MQTIRDHMLYPKHVLRTCTPFTASSCPHHGRLSLAGSSVTAAGLGVGEQALLSTPEFCAAAAMAKATHRTGKHTARTCLTQKHNVTPGQTWARLWSGKQQTGYHGYLGKSLSCSAALAVLHHRHQFFAIGIRAQKAYCIAVAHARQAKPPACPMIIVCSSANTCS